MRKDIHHTFDEFSEMLHSINEKDLITYKSRFFNKIEEIASIINESPDKEELKNEFFKLCSSIDVSLLHGRTRNKPLGYAGDYQLIDWIYTKKTAPSGSGKLFDILFHDYEAAQSVRNRKSYFIDKCLELAHDKTSQRFDVLNVACGSCRDVLETYTTSQNGHNIHFHCIDQEPKAIQYGKNLIKRIPNHNNVTFENKNAFHLKSKVKYDLIWSAGLFDYLEDKHAILLLKRMWKLLKNDGHIIFGNFSPLNPTRNGMELVGEWYLIHRTIDDLISLCTQAHIPFSEIEVDSEPNGINLFCIIRK